MPSVENDTSFATIEARRTPWWCSFCLSLLHRRRINGFMKPETLELLAVELRRRFGCRRSPSRPHDLTSPPWLPPLAAKKPKMVVGTPRPRTMRLPRLDPWPSRHLRRISVNSNKTTILLFLCLCFFYFILFVIIVEFILKHVFFIIYYNLYFFNIR